MTYNSLIDEIKKLPVEQRLELIDEIYESVDCGDQKTPLTPEQDAELSRRIATYKDRPELWVSLEQVDAEIDRLLAKK